MLSNPFNPILLISILFLLLSFDGAIVRFFVLGVESLIRKKVYTAAFPLHEVSDTSITTPVLKPIFCYPHIHIGRESGPIKQGRSQKFILGGYNFLLHDTAVLYTSSLSTSAAISAQNNFQGLILGGYIYRYTPRRYAPAIKPYILNTS